MAEFRTSVFATKTKMEPRLTGGEPKSSNSEKIVYFSYEIRDHKLFHLEQIIAMETVTNVLGQTREAIKDRRQHWEQT